MKSKDDTDQIWDAYITEADGNWTVQSKLDDAVAGLKGTTAREPLHWSMRQDEIKQKQRDAEIPRLTCFANDCIHWSAGDKCVAEEVKLSRKKDIDLGMTVICETYIAE